MKNLLPLAILLFISAGIWAVSKVGKKTNISISLHVAKSRLTCVIFGFSVFAAALLASYSIFGWVLPHYDASWLHYLLYVVLAMDFFTVALVPHIEGTWREMVHNVAAWGMVYVIPVAMIAAQFWSLSVPARLFTALITFVALLLLTLVLFQREKYRHVFLYFQVAYLMAFFVFLLAVTYL